ncbi:MAG: DUF2065 family protein [Desulfobacteraceae bacterium]|jgi:uncharacterized protein YjeT (DUF2065 family)|nr:DUF2065 family protein [Desulfobacteraceae bacterium]
MRIFLYAFSFLYIAAGACFILYTFQSRSFIRQVFEELSQKLIAGVAVVVGLALLAASPYSVHGWFVVLLGLLAILKGVLFFLNPEDVVTVGQKWFTNEASDQTYRFMGILMLVLGTALFSWML